ncbi:MAG: glutaredoxin [Planctomycetes bacterium]|nr:glutaredoxin [Planctomycetota bacterium]
MVKLRDGREVDLELFKFDSCPFCVRVMRKVKVMGLEGKVRYRDTLREPGAQDELVRRGGEDQVPCLFIDGQPMYESADIIAWLEENVGG